VFLKGKTVDSGVGRTIECSSAALRFLGERPIEAGLKLELAVRWPLMLEGGVPLKLVVSGEAIRSNGRETAIRIVAYEFRTRSKSEELPAHRGDLPYRLPPEVENHEPLRADAVTA
jgi:hypothetical protein